MLLTPQFRERQMSTSATISWFDSAHHKGTVNQNYPTPLYDWPQSDMKNARSAKPWLATILGATFAFAKNQIYAILYAIVKHDAKT